jgi:hypothetical protein
MKAFIYCSLLIILGLFIIGDKFKNYNQQLNQLGYIECVNGHWEIGNININGRNKNYSPVLNINDCTLENK